MNIKIDKKFSQINIDKFVHNLYSNYKIKRNDKYTFDLTEVEFIGNQELLVLSALFQAFVDVKIDFEVLFFPKGVSTDRISTRIKKQIIQIWQVWKIANVIPEHTSEKYFGINTNMVLRLQKELGYFPKAAELYTRHGVTPFVVLKSINNYHEAEVRNVIKPIYKLNKVVELLLAENQCHHPFTSDSLSTIVTEELYLNFLDHFTESSFIGFEQNAFMSISFHGMLDEGKHSNDEIQRLKKLNFETECLIESQSFFYDESRSEYKNFPYVEFSFLDFGKGIAETLKQQYIIQNPKFASEVNDSAVLKFSFEYSSSRHPIDYNNDVSEKGIPRGLFDALVIVRRYKGLLIVRSNYGKILFDFSISDDLDKACRYFGDDKSFFPGTLITLCIPALKDTLIVNTSAIKPEILVSKIKPKQNRYISIREIADTEPLKKQFLYSTFLREVKRHFQNSSNCLFLISFKGCEWVEKRLIKKILYFLLSDYDINIMNNVIVVDYPSNGLIAEISEELLLLSQAIKNYKIHPLPLVRHVSATDHVHVEWLGVFDAHDREKMNELMFEQYSISRSDFVEPNNVVGHFNEFDDYGNLTSTFPSEKDLKLFYREQNDVFILTEIKRLFLKYACIKGDTGKDL